MTANSSLDAETRAVVARLDAALERRFGASAHAENVVAATLGGSNRTLLFDLAGAGARRRLVFRQETIEADYTPFLPAGIQFEILQLAWRHGLLVPEPLFEFVPHDGLGSGYVVAAIAGETLPKRLLHSGEFATARARFPQQAGQFLAGLHAIDASEAETLEDVAESHDILAAWMEHYLRWTEPHPAIDFAFRWLHLNPRPAAARALVHGDFRIGNMLVGREGLRAVLDWECAHLGDPLEDLGWFCSRSWRFGMSDRHAGGLCDRETFYRAYEAAGGRPVDRAAARWWEIFGLLRWALYNLMQSYGHTSGRRPSPAFAACGRNIALIEYDLLMSIAGRFD